MWDCDSSDASEAVGTGLAHTASPGNSSLISAGMLDLIWMPLQCIADLISAGKSHFIWISLEK